MSDRVASRIVSRARAVCAAALALAFAATTLIAGWHQATVLHARCARHGELFHVGDGVHKKLGAHQIAARDGDRGDGEHDHCQLCPRAHDGAPPVPAHVRAVMPPAAPAPRLVPDLAIIASDHPLAHAPKTSPPRAPLAFV